MGWRRRAQRLSVAWRVSPWCRSPPSRRELGYLFSDGFRAVCTFCSAVLGFLQNELCLRFWVVAGPFFRWPPSSPTRHVVGIGRATDRVGLHRFFFVPHEKSFQKFSIGLHPAARVRIAQDRQSWGTAVDLTVFDHFAECLAVGVFTDEAWLQNVSRITRQSSHPTVRTDGCATFIVEAHSLTVCRSRSECPSAQSRRTGARGHGGTGARGHGGTGARGHGIPQPEGSRRMSARFNEMDRSALTHPENR